MDFEGYINQLRRIYFSELIMMLAEIVALITAIIWIRKYYIGRLFIFFISFDLCIYLTGVILPFWIKLDPKSTNKFIWVTNNLVAFVELIVYGYFFYKILAGQILKKIIIIFASFYAALILMYLITKFNFVSERLRYISMLISVLEFLFLFPLCLIFYKRLLQSNSKIKLFERPSFWIVTGIFFFSFLSVPHHLLSTLLVESK